MRFFAQPLWLAGFRPFFALACLAGMALPALWVLLYAGILAPPAGSLTLFQWHAHEMFFGFGWAVLGGFLLTSTKNWVRVRGYHGPALAFLAAAWLFERVGMWFGGHWPRPLFLLANDLFLASIVLMLAWTLVRHRARDSYRDNPFFLAVLPLFLLAKHLLLSPEHYAAGWSMCIGLFRMAFLLMLERTLTQFMKGAFQAAILRHAGLDGSIKALGLALVGVAWLPPLAGAALELALAAVLAVRFAFWKPGLALRRLDVGVMYLGYAAIVVQLAIDGVAAFLPVDWVGAVSVHVFTFGAMGLVIPAMMIRICKGHTGRKVAFGTLDKAALWIMIAGLVLRVLAPQLAPEVYLLWIALAGACWFACFALLAWRYIPFLLRPRIDGKEH